MLSEIMPISITNFLLPLSISIALYLQMSEERQGNLLLPGFKQNQESLTLQNSQ